MRRRRKAATTGGLLPTRAVDLNNTLDPNQFWTPRKQRPRKEFTMIRTNFQPCVAIYRRSTMTSSPTTGTGGLVVRRGVRQWTAVAEGGPSTGARAGKLPPHANRRSVIAGLLC